MRMIMSETGYRPRREDMILSGVLRLAREMRLAAQDGDLRGGPLSLLATLQREGAMSAVALARRQQLQPQSLTRHLARLDADGLIARSVDGADARRHVIAITPAGTTALMRQMVRRRDWLADRMADRLNADEQEALLNAAELMLRMAI
jgi:DNA-binding MarR family transcriptional regulator